MTFVKKYEGTCTDFIVENLSPGILYSFFVSATNFNGEGAKSDTLSLRSCVAPVDVLPPNLVEATDSEVYLRWDLPKSDGGCPIESFTLLSDLGDLNNDFTNEIDSASI